MGAMTTMSTKTPASRLSFASFVIFADIVMNRER
jgi:hypothetical protein